MRVFEHRNAGPGSRGGVASPDAHSPVAAATGQLVACMIVRLFGVFVEETRALSWGPLRVETRLVVTRKGAILGRCDLPAFAALSMFPCSREIVDILKKDCIEQKWDQAAAQSRSHARIGRAKTNHVLMKAKHGPADMHLYKVIYIWRKVVVQ
jgi:hypothetical protein